MKKKNLTALMAALALTVVASSSLLCGNGIVSYEGEMDETGSEIAEITPASVCTNILYPLVENGDKHNCFVTYKIRQRDAHGTNVEFVKSPSYTIPSYTRSVPQNGTCTILGFADEDDYECEPYPYYIRARCPDCQVASPTMSTLIDFVQESVEVEKEDCRYKPMVVKDSGTIWMHFDQGAPGMEWSHGGLSGGTIIYYSIAYNGIVTDGSLPVPKWFEFSKTQEHVIDGVTFTVRVSGGYVAVKASQNVICNNLDTAFAFGVA